MSFFLPFGIRISHLKEKTNEVEIYVLTYAGKLTWKKKNI